MIRVCPKRDAACPHGMDCPYSIDRYHCAQEPKEPPKPRPTPPPVAEDVARLVADLSALADYFYALEHDNHGDTVREAATALSALDATVLSSQAEELRQANKQINDAYAARYGRHERGFILKPLIDPPSLAEIITQLRADYELYFKQCARLADENEALDARAEDAEAKVSSLTADLKSANEALRRHGATGEWSAKLVAEDDDGSKSYHVKDPFGSVGLVWADSEAGAIETFRAARSLQQGDGT